MNKVLHKIKNFFFVPDEDAIEELENENAELKEKLSAAIKKIRSYENKIESLANENQTLKNVVLKMMPIEQLRQMDSAFPVKYNSQTGKWRVVTAICNQHGCEYKYNEYDSEINAYRAAVLMTMKGEKPELEYSCSDCYTQYMKSVG